jgi:8-oxo-dGTP diphosphatase
MMLVTAGLLAAHGRILVCQRRAGAPHGLQWEFPGGKAEAEEQPEACLARELGEELGIRAVIGPELFSTEHRYPAGPHVQLRFYRVPVWSGVPVNLAFEQIVWTLPSRLVVEDFLEADRGFVRRLKAGEITG